jgi:glycosyltransferase involved in cell wall biosynthesis
MSRAVVVDWLGRGGIAQTTPAWVRALERRGHAVTVVTRGGRELTGPNVRSPHEGPHALVGHRRVARLAADTVDELDPEVVVVQNYVVPPLERPLDAALRRSNARTVLVVHDQRLHTRAAGTHAGLRRRLLAADAIVTHTRFVADAVTAATGRHDVTVLPLPVPDLGRGGRNLLGPTPDRTAINFGIMNRRYKGGDVVCDLAAVGVPGWRFAIAGVGAPTDRPGVAAIDGFLPAPDLAATLAASAAAVLPYRAASQSAAVLLAQSLGVVPVVTAVGGLREQITHGVDGILLAPDAPLRSWSVALECVAADHDVLSHNAHARAARAEASFWEQVHALA